MRKPNPHFDACQEDFSDLQIFGGTLPIPRTDRAAHRLALFQLRRRSADTRRRHLVPCGWYFQRGAGDTALLNLQLGMPQEVRTGQT
jgi:hypothetical protein